MRHPDRRNPGAGRGVGASDSVVLDGFDTSEDATFTADYQACWLVRRFGLRPDRARLVAELAMPAGGAA